MSNSGSGFNSGDMLRVAISLPLLIAVIGALSDGTDEQRGLGAALASEMPGVVLANVASRHDETPADE